MVVHPTWSVRTTGAFREDGNCSPCERYMRWEATIYVHNGLLSFHGKGCGGKRNRFKNVLKLQKAYLNCKVTYSKSMYLDRGTR